MIPSPTAASAKAEANTGPFELDAAAESGAVPPELTVSKKAVESASYGSSGATEGYGNGVVDRGGGGVGGGGGEEFHPRLAARENSFFDDDDEDDEDRFHEDEGDALEVDQVLLTELLADLKGENSLNVTALLLANE